MNHTQKHTRKIQIVDMVTKLCVVMMIDAASQFKHIEEKMLSLDSLKKWFEEVDCCKEITRKYFNKPLKMSDKDEQIFNKAKECHICGRSYKQKDITIRDHCHITGKYRGSAHQDCNFNHFRLKVDKIKIPVIFQNL